MNFDFFNTVISTIDFDFIWNTVIRAINVISLIYILHVDSDSDSKSFIRACLISMWFLNAFFMIII